MIAERLLAFDFGLRRTGVASGQMLTKTAKPLTTLLCQQGEPNWNEVTNLIQEWEPEALVVGLPLNMDGSEQTITQKAREFAQALEKQTGITVYLHDERLSTASVRETLFEAGGYKALKKNQIDAHAAAAILESFMHEY